MPDQTTLDVIQKYILLATGAPGSHALRDEVIKLYEQTNDLSLVNEQVDTFMDQQVQTHEKGIVGVVQTVARNGFGLNLSDEESQQLITDLAAQGINSWSQIFAFATTAVNQDLNAILDNRSEAANLFTDLLAALDKDGDYNGSQATSAAREWIAGIGALDATLVAATDGAQDLVNSFVDGNVQGKAFDGYISGATVFIDTNQDGELSPGELSTTTDELGNFMFEGDIPDGSLIATGGTDIATNQPFTGTLSGPQGTFVLSPLTTLVHQLLQNGQAENIVAAEDILFQSLGIPRIDLSNFDPIDIGLDPDASAEEQSAALQLQAITAQISNLLTVSSTLLSNVAGVTGDAMQSVAGSLREILVSAAQNDQVVDLTDLLTIQNIITTGAANSGIAGNIEAPVSQVATVLAEINTITQQAAQNEDNADVQTAFSDIIKFQTLIQAQVLPKAVAALETGDLSAVVTEFTDDTLVDNIDNVLLEGVLNAVTPESLNTLVDELLQNNQVVDRLTAEDILFQSLDIPRVDLSSFDPIEVGLDPDTTTLDQSTALQLQAITAQILNVLSVSSALIDNAAGTTGSAIQSVTSSLVETLISAAQNDQTVDLTDVQTLTDIITTAAANSGIVGNTDAPASQIATVLADINTVTQQAAESSNTNTQTAFTDIAKVQSLTQTQVIPAAEEALETGDLSEVVTEFTDDNLADNIDEVAITGTLNDSTPVDNGETNNPAPPTTTPPTTKPPPPLPPADTDAPTLDSSTPTDDATGVALGDNIVLTFNESVVAGTGNIVINDGSGDTRTIDVTDGTQVSFSGSSVTINPTADLNNDATYNVQMVSGVIKDSSGNAFAGISNTTTLNFNTPDTLNPTLVGSTPADDAAAVAVGSNIVLTFSETVVAGTGNIVISNGGDTRTIDVTDGTQVSFSGKTVTINPTADLNANTIYNVQMASGVIEDATGKAYAGINDNTTLNIDTTIKLGLSVIEPDSNNGGFVVKGVSASDESGRSVSSAGDVNGDGLADLIVGAPYDDPNGSNSGASFVVFGKANGTAVELSDIDAGTGGFAINGVSADDQSGRSVSNAGDVNGDGLADLIVGARYDDPNGSKSGASFVVFGKASGTTVELSDIDAGNGGFVINGVAGYDQSGFSVSSADDVNGDGLTDLIVGAFQDDPNVANSGASFVVFGKTNGTAVELSDIDAGTGGFVINGISANDVSGKSVSNAGDVNGDGLADLIVGAPYDDPNGSGSGASFVVFGKTNGTTIELSDIEAGNGGFSINGVGAGDNSGYSVSTAGDVNGDGLADLIVGARFDAPNGAQSGASFVVFGKTNGTTIELSDIEAGNGGFVINGVGGGNRSGDSVSSAGDVNGDGLTDLIVGAYTDAPNGVSSGASFVIFGKTNGTTVELSDIEAGNGGFVINGSGADDRSGKSVSSAGDMNGDGFADLIVGAQRDDPNGGNSGASFVVFGGQGSSATIGSSGIDTLNGDGNANQLVAGAGNDTLVGNGGADVLRGGAGDDILAVSDLTFASLDGGTGSDTLRFDAALSLDLRALADTKLNSIEKIDLANDGGNSTLSLNILDVLNLNETQTATNTLVINGSAGDTINLYDNSNGQTGTWADAGGGVYQFSVGGIGVIGTATIDAAVTVNIIV